MKKHPHKALPAWLCPLTSFPKKLNAILWFAIFNCGAMLLKQIYQQNESDLRDVARRRDDGSPWSPHGMKTRPQIAIISSYVAGGQSQLALTADFDHLINKACYAKMWGYDFIFNMTYGFDKAKDQVQGGAYWLDYGTWQRVPHIRDRLNDYDWVLYADVDYVINDIKKPLESFFNEWQLFGKHPSIFVPKDFDDNEFTFSAFAVLVKNDPFGKSVIDHWMKFGRGLCEKGNLSNETRDYTWLDSDQPGLWYALTQAHKDFFPQLNVSVEATSCDPTTGLIKTDYAYMDGLSNYFRQVGIRFGAEGSDLKDIPSDQPILWSLPKQNSSGGLGMQLNWGVDGERAEGRKRNAFAIHEKKVDKWPQQAQDGLQYCKSVYGCYARYNDRGVLEIGCDGVNYTVAI